MKFEMDEKWNIYKGDIVPVDKYEVISVSQSCEGTKIILEGNTYTLEVQFGSTDSFRITDEGGRLRTYNEVKSIQEYRNEFIGQPLFTVDNSEFLTWLMKESAGFYENCVHYAIMTINDIVDIAATFPPEITVKPNEGIRKL